MMGSRVLTASVDTRAYMTVMSKIRRKEFPESVAATLNRIANAVTIGQEMNVRKEFTLRSKSFTMKSMRSKSAAPTKALNAARGTNLKRMFSRAGTFSKYLWKQEDSMTVRGFQGEGVPIPTEKARIGKSDLRPVAKRYRLSRKKSLGNRPRNEFIGRPYGGGKRGIYLRHKGRLILIRSLEHYKVKIKGTGFHQKAVDKYGSNQKIAAVYRREFRKRMGL